MDTLEEILRALGRIEGLLAGISRLSDRVSYEAPPDRSLRAAFPHTAPTLDV
jgi:hypothetical protein